MSIERELIFEVLESVEGGFEARALGESIFTQAETLDQLKEMVRDAVYVISTISVVLQIRSFSL